MNELPLLKTGVSWEMLFGNGDELRLLERDILPSFMRKCRWFGGKARVVSKACIYKAIPVRVGDDTHFLLVIEVHYLQRQPECYFLPLIFVAEINVGREVEYDLQSAVCRAEIAGESGFVMDSAFDRRFREFLFLNIEKNSRLKDREDGILEFNSGTLEKRDTLAITSKILKADQSNTAIIYDDQYFFKFYRKVEKEINPDLEIIRFLTEKTNFRHSPRFAGSIQYRDGDDNTIVFGLLQQKVENQGDAWTMTMDSIASYYEAVLKLSQGTTFDPLVEGGALVFDDAPALIRNLIDRRFVDRIALLGRRTAEMHKALASDTTETAFAPEELAPDQQRSLYSELPGLLDDRFGLLRDALPRLDAETRLLASEVLSFTDPILGLFAEMENTRNSATITRIHGDYHLGQVLFTGDDFVIIDFEGEPGFSFPERRLKKSPLKDVAGMMRSFHYAAYGKILLNNNYRVHNPEILERAADQWQHYVSRFFLGAYLEHAGMDRNLSKENRILIRTFLLEKAIYELGYELNARPDWVNVPLRGIQYLVKRYGQQREQE